MQAEWEAGDFRDCNGISNGSPLDQEILDAEAKAEPYKGKPAGAVGPPPVRHKIEKSRPDNKLNSKTGKDHSVKSKKSGSFKSKEVKPEKFLSQNFQKRIMNDIFLGKGVKEPEKKSSGSKIHENLPVKTKEGIRQVRQPFTAFSEHSDEMLSDSNPISISVHIHEHDSDESEEERNAELMKELKKYNESKRKEKKIKTLKSFSDLETHKSKALKKMNKKNETSIKEEEAKSGDDDKDREPRESKADAQHGAHPPPALPFSKPVALVNVNQHNGKSSSVFTAHNPLSVALTPGHPVLLDTNPINTLHPHPPVPVMNGQFLQPDPPPVPIHEGYGAPPDVIHELPLHPIAHVKDNYGPLPSVTPEPHHPPLLLSHPTPIHPPLTPIPPHPHPSPTAHITGGYGVHPPLIPNDSHHSHPGQSHPSIQIHDGYGPHPPPHPNPHHPVPPEPQIPIVDNHDPHHPILADPYHPVTPHVSPPIHNGFGFQPPLQLLPNANPALHSSPNTIEGFPPLLLNPTPTPILENTFPGALIDPHSPHDFIGPLPLPLDVDHKPPPLIPHPHEQPKPLVPVNEYEVRPKPFVHFGPKHTPPPTVVDVIHSSLPAINSLPTPAPKPLSHIPLPEPAAVNPTLPPLNPILPTPHPVSPQPVVHQLPPQPFPGSPLPNLLHGSPQPSLIHGSPQPVLQHGSPQPLINHGSPQPALHGSLQPALHGSVQLYLDGSPQPALHGSPQTPIFNGTPQPAVVNGSPQPAVVHGSPQPALIHGSPQPGVIHATPQPAIDIGPVNQAHVSYLPPQPQPAYFPPQQYLAYAYPVYPYFDISPNYDSYLPQIHSLSTPNLFDPGLYVQPLPQPLNTLGGHPSFTHPVTPTPFPDHHIEPVLPRELSELQPSIKPHGDHGHQVGPVISPSPIIHGDHLIVGPTPEPIFRPPPGFALVKSKTPSTFGPFDNVPLRKSGKRKRRKLDKEKHVESRNEISANSRIEIEKGNSLSKALVKKILNNITLTTKMPVVRSLPRNPRTFYLNAKSNNYLRDISSVFQPKLEPFHWTSEIHSQKDINEFKSPSDLTKSRGESGVKKDAIEKNVYRSKIEIFPQTTTKKYESSSLPNVIVPTILPRNNLISGKIGLLRPNDEQYIDTTVMPKDIDEVSTAKPKSSHVEDFSLTTSKAYIKNISLQDAEPLASIKPQLSDKYETINLKMNTSNQSSGNPKSMGLNDSDIENHIRESMKPFSLLQEERFINKRVDIKAKHAKKKEKPSPFVHFGRPKIPQTKPQTFEQDKEIEIQKLHMTIENLNQEIAKIMNDIDVEKKKTERFGRTVESKKKEKVVRKVEKETTETSEGKLPNSTKKREKDIVAIVEKNQNSNTQESKRLQTTLSTSKYVDAKDSSRTEVTSTNMSGISTTRVYYPTEIETTTNVQEETTRIPKQQKLRKNLLKKIERKIRIKKKLKKPKIQPYEYPLVDEEFAIETTKSPVTFENFVTPVPESDTTTVVYAIPVKELEENDHAEETTTQDY